MFKKFIVEIKYIEVVKEDKEKLRVFCTKRRERIYIYIMNAYRIVLGNNDIVIIIIGIAISINN